MEEVVTWWRLRNSKTPYLLHSDTYMQVYTVQELTVYPGGPLNYPRFPKSIAQGRLRFCTSECILEQLVTHSYD